MINKVIYIVYFGNSIPNYVNFVVKRYSEINPDFDVKLIHYTTREINLIKKQSKPKSIKYDFDFLLHYILGYTKQQNKCYTMDDLLCNYRYCIINHFGGICVTYKSLPIKPFDEKLLQYENFSCNVKDYYNSNIKSNVFIGCQKNKITEPCTYLDSIYIDNYMPIKNNILFYNCDTNIFNYTFNDTNTSYIDLYNPQKIKITNNAHKYCVYYSIYDLNNTISQGNLYYFKGLIEALCIDDRNFDIHVDTTKQCYDVIMELCNSINIELKDIRFNIRKQPKYSEGTLWRLNSALNEYDKYDTILLCDSDLEIVCDLFNIQLNNNISIYNKYDAIDNEIRFCWNDKYIPSGMTYIKFKNFKSDVNKIKYIIEKILQSDLPIFFGMDEYINNHIFIYELLYNKYSIIHTDNIKQSYLNDILTYKNIDDIFNYNLYKYANIKNNNFILNNINYQFYNHKPKNHMIQPNIDYNLKLKYKYMYIQIEKYILGTINKFEVIKNV